MKAKWLYVVDYWDGPLSGMVQYKGESLWAHCLVDEPKPGGGWHREFGLYRMPPGWRKKEAKRHKLWNECCGNYSYDLPKDHTPSRPIDDFYSQYPPGKAKREDPERRGVLVVKLDYDDIVYPKRKR